MVSDWNPRPEQNRRLWCNSQISPHTYIPSQPAFNYYIAKPIQSGKDEGFRVLKALVEATSL